MSFVETFSKLFFSIKAVFAVFAPWKIVSPESYLARAVNS
jgi:hypothetical protein